MNYWVNAAWRGRCDSDEVFRNPKLIYLWVSCHLHRVSLLPLDNTHVVSFFSLDFNMLLKSLFLEWLHTRNATTVAHFLIVCVCVFLPVKEWLYAISSHINDSLFVIELFFHWAFYEYAWTHHSVNSQHLYSVSFLWQMSVAVSWKTVFAMIV